MTHKTRKQRKSPSVQVGFSCALWRPLIAVHLNTKLQVMCTPIYNVANDMAMLRHAVVVTAGLLGRQSNDGGMCVYVCICVLQTVIALSSRQRACESSRRYFAALFLDPIALTEISGEECVGHLGAPHCKLIVHNLCSQLCSST